MVETSGRVRLRMYALCLWYADPAFLQAKYITRIEFFILFGGMNVRPSARASYIVHCQSLQGSFLTQFLAFRSSLMFGHSVNTCIVDRSPPRFIRDCLNSARALQCIGYCSD